MVLLILILEKKWLKIFKVISSYDNSISKWLDER